MIDGKEPNPETTSRWAKTWSHRTDVQKVELYTAVSLYLLVWWTGLMWLLVLRGSGRDGAWAAAVIVTVAVMGALGTWGVRMALTHRAAIDPVEPDARRLLIVSVPLMAALLVAGLRFPEPTDSGPAVLITVFFGAAWVIGVTRNVIVAAGAAVLWGVAVFGYQIPAIPALSMVGVYLFFVGSLRVSLWVLRVVYELDEARGVQSRLAVAEERLRFSRDVHDVLGRHLSTIAVRSELAARLVERDAQRAEQEMLGVRAAAQDALREARALARGYRETDLQAELDGATSLLASAGIRSRCDLDAIPPNLHEPAGWVIREAITNVLRHADATEVTVIWTPGDTAGTGTLTVTNDGPRPAGESDSGSGIRGLRERLTPVGATVEAERDADRFSLVTRFG